MAGPDTLVGVGTDIVEIARVADLLARHGDRFLQRCFRPGEIAALEAGGGPFAARVASYWAAKEAALKALAGDVGAVSYRDIEVRVTRQQARVELYGPAAELLRRSGGRRLLLSLGRSRRQAVALAVAGA